MAAPKAVAYQQLCSIDPASQEQKLRGDENPFDPALFLGLAKQQAMLLTTLQQKRNHLPQVCCPGIDISTVRQVSTGRVTQRNAWTSMKVTACVCMFFSALMSVCVAGFWSRERA